MSLFADLQISEKVKIKIGYSLDSLQKTRRFQIKFKQAIIFSTRKE